MVLEKYSDCASLKRFLCVFISVFCALLLIDYALSYCLDREICFIDLLFVASEPALIIAILGIIAATEVTAYTILFLIVNVSSSVQVKAGNEVYSSTSLTKSLTKVILLPSTAKITVIGLFLLIVALYSQDALPNIVWLIVLGLLVVFTIYEIWVSSKSVYYILIQCQPDHELYCELQEMTEQPGGQTIRTYRPKPHNMHHARRTQYPKLYTKIHNHLKENGLIPQSYTEWKLRRILDLAFIEDISNSIHALKKMGQESTILHLLHTGDSNQLFKTLTPKNPDPVDITKICLEIMDMYNSLNEKPLPHGFRSLRSRKDFQEVCLVLLYKQIAALRKKGTLSWISNRYLHYINPNETHMYMLYGSILYDLGKYEYKYSKQAREYYQAAIDAYEYANIADPSNKLALENMQFIERIISNLESENRKRNNMS